MRKIGNEGSLATVATSRVDRWWNTYQLLVAHQKPLRSIFHVALLSPPSRGQPGWIEDFSEFHLLQNSFRYELFESEFEPRQDVEYFIKLWNIFGFPLLKDFSSSLLEGYFIISLVEIKLEMKLDKSCAGYEKLRDYVSSLGWRMYFFFVPGKPIFHEEFSNQEHSSSCWIRMVVETVRSSIRYIKEYKCHSDYDRSRTSALVNILHFLTEWIFITRYTQDLTFYIIFIEKNLEYSFTIIYYHEELIRFQEILKQIRIINSSSSYVIYGMVNY